MNIKHIYSIVTLIVSSASLLPATATAASVNDYPGIKEYVGSERLPASVSHFCYTADGTAYLQLSSDHRRIVKYDIKSGKELETVLDLGHTRETTISNMDGFIPSPEGSKILVYKSKEMVYRRSFTAEYYVYELRSRLLKPLSNEHKRQQSPVFSPDGRMVAFVADNNVILKKLDYGTELPVTKDGARNSIINGVPDWTYEEEFSTSCSMAWSPDNLTLCFLKYNESDVPTFSFPLYEGSCDPMHQYALYPGAFTYKYPVAGQKNSKVSLHSYDVETRKTKELSLPDSKIEYIPRIEFGHSPDRLMVTALNRAQDRMELYSVNPRTTIVKSVLVEQWNAWLNPATYEDIRYFPEFFVVSSCRSGYQHLYQYSYAGSMQRQITSGEYDVDQYYGFDTRNQCHYYRSTATGAINRAIYRIDGKNKITCMSPEQGYATASFSPGMDFFVMNYSSATTAPTYTLHSAPNGKEVRVLENNLSYSSKWADAPVREFFTMQSHGNTLNGYIIKPSSFNSSKKYPVVMYQYSGPGSQEVLNKWSIGWENYFAKVGYIVICVDGRGTGGRGRAFSDVVYKCLGKYESIDQIAAAEYAAKLPYVDAARIAIYGWSYGGYEAIMAASQPNAPYAAAIAVAPVTDWRYYDTVYAERYMLTPQENEEGYDQSSAMQHIADRRCPLLIMSGTADDNVHLFNTIQYVSETESHGKWCDMLLFPNMNHSINGCNSREVVFARMLDYLGRNMK